MFSDVSPRDQLCIRFRPVELEMLMGIFYLKLSFEKTRMRAAERHFVPLRVLREEALVD